MGIVFPVKHISTVLNAHSVTEETQKSRKAKPSHSVNEEHQKLGKAKPSHAQDEENVG